MDISPSNDDFHNSWEFGDEYDESDYDGWYEDQMDGWDEYDWDEYYSTSWEQEAVDEAIDEEEPGQYPSGDGDIAW